MNCRSSVTSAKASMRAWLISNQRDTPVSVPILACSCAIVIVGLEGSKRLMAPLSYRFPSEPGPGASATLVSCLRTRASRIPRALAEYRLLATPALLPGASLAPPRRVPLDTRFRGYDNAGLPRKPCSSFLDGAAKHPEGRAT